MPARFDPGSEPALSEALKRRKPLERGDEASAALGAGLGIEQLGIAPLPGSSRCAGIVLLARKAGAAPFDPFTRNLVRTLSIQSGLALERVRVHENLREASIRDELTGVGNRRSANMRLEKLGPGDALALLDLDHFKRINDTLGHAAGDEVLRDLGAFLGASLREGDEVFRMGGEEFLVVLRDAADGALIAGERLCDGWRFSAPATTFSSGVALHREGSTAEATLQRADEALYEAKRAGRDRVCLAEELPPADPR
ncbi:MAG: GGDEF domain-containing protein [bacterium]|nr:GGDEF domain-containing protein [bacterium]